MKFQRQFFILCAIFLMGQGPDKAHAEAGPSILKLMAEKVSVFDLGMLRLELYLNRIPNPGSVSIAYEAPVFNWSDNRIEIAVNAHFQEDSSDLAPWRKLEYKGDWAERCAYRLRLCPLPPLTPIGSTAFREGIKAGIKAAQKNKARGLKRDPYGN